MKLVRCNKCNNEYYICEFTDKLGIIQDIEMCDSCHTRKDYTIIDDDVKVTYNTEYARDLEIENVDLRHSLSLFKEELDELVKTYIEPFLK